MTGKWVFAVKLNISILTLLDDFRHLLGMYHSVVANYNIRSYSLCKEI